MTAAQSKYQFLKNNPMMYMESPQEGQGYAETWPAGETGSPDRPRPTQFPLEKVGIQVFKPGKFSADDIAGEALHIDPVASRYRDQFTSSISPQQWEELKRQPDYEGDGAEDQRKKAVIDAAMRGYTVNQWPKDAVDRFFSPSQRTMLDGLKNYMETGKE